MYHGAMSAQPDAPPSTIETPVAAPVRERHDIPLPDTWNLDDIFPDPAAWEAGCAELEAGIRAFATRQGSLSSGADALLEALQASDTLGQLAYRVYYDAALRYDQDQRDNAANGRRQRVQHLLALWRQATSWFNPELLALTLPRVQAWMQESAALALYRFSIEDLYRQQEHVLDEKGERLLSLSSQFGNAAENVYEALATADATFPTVRLSSGEAVEATYAKYRAILATNRSQPDRAAVFAAHHQPFADHRNTYAALYNAVLQRDWFHAQARGYPTMLDAALHGNNIPTAVVENLIASTRAGVAPLQRYERLRRKVLGLPSYHVYDGSISLVEFDRTYRYADVLDWVTASTAPLGAGYQARVRRAFAERWIDVYENKGKHSGAYSAAVYGVHPYMLLNWNDTLDAVFTLAHEMGHSMHTMLAHEAQPFVYSSYTIFVAEVPSTLSEALLLDYMLERATDPRERIVLLQHAIDEVTSTFYRQVLFAAFELEAHRRVERGEPVTAEALSAIYGELLREFYGETLDYDDLLDITWARIPHFYGAPYYVYQYATCFASSARLHLELASADPGRRQDGVDRFLTLLRSGSCDHPMALLKRAGIDLEEPATVQAIVAELDTLVSKLEGELAQIGLVH